MSVYSTARVTRRKALEMIQAKMFAASNQTLGEVLFELYGNERLEDTTLNNYTVVDDD